MAKQSPKSSQSISPETLASKLYGAYWGFFLGDALGIPSHGYSTTRLLRNDYGMITNFVQPRFPHPESMLFRTRYEVINEKNEILHGRMEEWRIPGTHYHQNLRPGDNALEARLAALLMESICTQGTYDEAAYRPVFLDFMLTPGCHEDTYIPTAYREFFANYARGKDIEQCGVDSVKAGGLTLILPLIWMHHRNAYQGARQARQRLALTHPGPGLSRTTEMLAEVHCALFRGLGIEEILLGRLREKHHPYVNYPFRRWIERNDDEAIACHHLRTSAEIDDAVPLVFYLALKYQDDTEAALIANANLGGETCARGALLGSLLGAANGSEEIPGELVEKLARYEELDALADRFLPLAMTDFSQ